MDYLEFIARVTSHIPDKGQVIAFSVFLLDLLIILAPAGSSAAAGP